MAWVAHGWGPRPSLRSWSPWCHVLLRLWLLYLSIYCQSRARGCTDTHLDCVGANPFTLLPAKEEPSKRFPVYCAWGPRCSWAVSHPAPKSIVAATLPDHPNCWCRWVLGNTLLQGVYWGLCLGPTPVRGGKEEDWPEGKVSLQCRHRWASGHSEAEMAPQSCSSWAEGARVYPALTSHWLLADLGRCELGPDALSIRLAEVQRGRWGWRWRWGSPSVLKGDLDGAAQHS